MPILYVRAISSKRCVFFGLCCTKKTMKRFEGESAEEETPRFDRTAKAKLKRQKMTLDELRLTIRDKLLRVYARATGGGRGTAYKIWDAIILESQWTFRDTLDIISSMRTPEDATAAFWLSEYLANNDFPWKHWFFAEFGDVVRDLKIDPHDAEIPYYWLRVARKKAASDPHPDDVLFTKVPWRSAYMWTAMFRRRCAKYYAEFYLRFQKKHYYRSGWNDPEEMTNFSAMRDSVELVETGDGVMTVNYTDKWGRKKIVHNIDEEVADVARMGEGGGERLRQTYGIVARAWMMWQNVRRNATTRSDPDFFNELGKKVIRLQPNVGKDRAHVAKGDEFEYNFGPEDVDCFMRYYMVRMVVVGSIPQTIDDWNPVELHTFRWAELLYHVDGPILQDVLEASEALGFVVVKALDDEGLVETIWPQLNRLPLCPRRIDKRDPEKRAVQFLGAREL